MSSLLIPATCTLADKLSASVKDALEEQKMHFDARIDKLEALFKSQDAGALTTNACTSTRRSSVVIATEDVKKHATLVVQLHERLNEIKASLGHRLVAGHLNSVPVQTAQPGNSNLANRLDRRLRGMNRMLAGVRNDVSAVQRSCSLAGKNHAALVGGLANITKHVCSVRAAVESSGGDAQRLRDLLVEVKTLVCKNDAAPAAESLRDLVVEVKTLVGKTLQLAVKFKDQMDGIKSAAAEPTSAVKGVGEQLARLTEQVQIASQMIIKINNINA